MPSSVRTGRLRLTRLGIFFCTFSMLAARSSADLRHKDRQQQGRRLSSGS